MDEYQQILDLIQTKNSASITLEPRRTALIVVDMERYYTEPSSALIALFNVLSPGAADGYLQRVSDTVIPNNQKILACFRALHSPIIFTAIGTETGMATTCPVGCVHSTSWVRPLWDAQSFRRSQTRAGD